MSRFKGQLLANIHSLSVFAEGQQWLKEAFSMCQEFRHEIPLRLQRADHDEKCTEFRTSRLWAPYLPGSAKAKTAVSV
jgi:hypothetical protein